jgi:hypothetical protein
MSTALYVKSRDPQCSYSENWQDIPDYAVFGHRIENVQSMGKRFKIHWHQYLDRQCIRIAVPFKQTDPPLTSPASPISVQHEIKFPLNDAVDLEVWTLEYFIPLNTPTNPPI